MKSEFLGDEGSGANLFDPYEIWQREALCNSSP
jgi:hypothetical protein